MENTDFDIYYSIYYSAVDSNILTAIKFARYVKIKKLGLDDDNDVNRWYELYAEWEQK